MTLIKKKHASTPSEWLILFGCSHKTVLKGGAGTGELTRIRNGPRQVRFILEEVLELAQRQEEEAPRQPKRPVKK